MCQGILFGNERESVCVSEVRESGRSWTRGPIKPIHYYHHSTESSLFFCGKEICRANYRDHISIPHTNQTAVIGRAHTAMRERQR